MNLKNYEWFRNPRGLHNSGPFRPLNIERYLRPKMGWAKLVAGSDEYVDEAAVLIENNCMPIIRIHRVDMGAMAVSDDWYTTYQAYYDAGCRWFELYNEPNTEEAWPKNPDGEPVVDVDWENTEGCIRPLMDNWLDWAECMIGMGAYPAFPALAASSERETATVYWLDALLNYLGQNHRERFMRIVGSGLWCAAHPYLLNHFYQEPPGGPPHVARPYYQQSADEESGWHFEYPYDPILQHHDPRRTVFGATKSAPYGDTEGLIAAGEAFQQLLKHRFNAGPVPVIGTEGGITPIPKPGDRIVQPDKLYPAYSAESHAEATLAMWRWIVDSGPDWLFGVALTDEAEYYDIQGEVPAVQRMAEAPITLKDVADIDTGGVKAAELPEPEAEPAVIIEGRAEAITGSEPVAVSTEEAVSPTIEPVSEEIVPDLLAAPGLDEVEIVEAAVDKEVEEQLPSIGWDDEEQAAEPETAPTVIIEDEAEGEPAAEDVASPTVEVDVLELLTPPGAAAGEKVEVHEGADEEAAVEAPVAAATVEEEVEQAPADETLEEPVPTWIEELETGESEAVSGRPAWVEGLDLVAVESGAPLSAAEPSTIEEPEPEPEQDEQPEEPEEIEEPGEELPEWVEEFDRGIVEAVLAISTESQAPQVEEETPQPELSEETLGEEVVEAQPAELPAEEVKEEDFEVEVLEMPDWLDESEVFTGEGIEVEEQALPEVPPEPEEEPVPVDQQPEEYIPSFARADEEEIPDQPEAEPAAEPEMQIAPYLSLPEPDRIPAWQVEPKLEAAEEEKIEKEPSEQPAPPAEISQYWLLIAPGFNQEWFFDAGVRYWQKFRPVVLPDWEMADQLAAGQTIAVTVLANSDTVEQVEAHLQQIDGIVKIDSITVDTPEDLRAELEWRVNTDKQMG
ncbi:MAG: hypothetical protein JXJ17_16130 [Anaerolineae bacterium]|nr:hypothetical protein [Anaerolineae bacterium]